MCKDPDRGPEWKGVAVLVHLATHGCHQGHQVPGQLELAAVCDVLPRASGHMRVGVSH